MRLTSFLFLISLLIACFQSCNRSENSQYSSKQNVETVTDSARDDKNFSNFYKTNVTKNIDRYRVFLYEDTSKQADTKLKYWNKYLVIEDTVDNRITFRKNCFDRFSERDSSLWRVDLDNDGKNELLIFGGSGATPYVSEQCLIIDFKIKPAPILVVNNADPKKVNEEYLIKIDVRDSPYIMMNGYTYCVKYENGKLIYKYVKGLTGTYCLCPSNGEGYDDPEKCLEILSEKKKICADEAAYGYFKMFILNKVLLDKQPEGWDLFNKLYNCKDKKEKQKELEEEINGIVEDIMNGDYKYESIE